MDQLLMETRYRGKRLPNEFGLMIGDIATNLRAVLDHIVWALVSPNLTSEDRKEDVGFPFVRERAALKRHIKRSMIERAGPKATELIDAIAPYPGGDDDLYELHTLSNNYKHRLVAVVSDFVELHRVIDVKGKRKPVDLGGIRLGAGPGLHRSMNIFGKGIAIARDGTVDPSQFEMTFHLAFADEGPFPRQPVIPTLTKLSIRVGDILSQFEGHFPSLQLSEAYFDDQPWRRR